MVHLSATRGGSISATPAVGRGRQAYSFAEDHTEIALVAKAYLLADAGHRLICIGQQGLRPFDAIVSEIFHERQAGGLFEEVHKVRPAHSADPRSFPNLNRLAAVLSQIAEEPEKPVESGLLTLEGLYLSCVRGVLVHQQDEKHLQIRLHREPGPRRGGR